MGDPATLEGRDKLYLVNSTFTLFARPLFDARAPLPAALKPNVSLRVTLAVGELHPAGKSCTLRVVTAQPATDGGLTVQVNGRALGAARLATVPHLFPEPYDQKPPELAQCLDFIVDGAVLQDGANEISLLATVPVTVTSIELAVVTPR